MASGPTASTLPARMRMLEAGLHFMTVVLTRRQLVRCSAFSRGSEEEGALAPEEDIEARLSASDAEKVSRNRAHRSIFSRAAICIDIFALRLL